MQRPVRFGKIVLDAAAVIAICQRDDYSLIHMAGGGSVTVEAPSMAVLDAIEAADDESASPTLPDQNVPKATTPEERVANAEEDVATAQQRLEMAQFLLNGAQAVKTVAEGASGPGVNAGVLPQQ